MKLLRCLIVTAVLAAGAVTQCQGQAVLGFQADPTTLPNNGAGVLRAETTDLTGAPSGWWTYRVILSTSGSIKFTGAGSINGGAGWDQTVGNSWTFVEAGIYCVAPDTAATITGTIEFFDQSNASLGEGTVTPVSVGQGSAPPGDIPNGFKLKASDICPDDGDPVDVELESDDPRIASYGVAVNPGNGELEGFTVGGNNGNVSFNAAGQTGATGTIFAVARDADGNVVAERNIKFEIGKEGCDGQDGEDDDNLPGQGGSDGGANGLDDKCLADVDCWCRRIKENDSFWIVILKRAFMPCPCLPGGNTPMCQVMAGVELITSWGPFGLISELIELKNEDAGTKGGLGIPLLSFDGPGVPGPGVNAAGTAVFDWTIVTGWSGWSWLRGVMGFGVMFMFARHMMASLQPKQLV